MERDPWLPIRDAQQGAEAILRITAGLSFDDDLANEMIRSAVERQFEILGDPLDRLRRADPPTASRISGLKGAVALRDLLIHGYESVDDSTVWTIVQHDVSVMIFELKAVVGEA